MAHRRHGPGERLNGLRCLDSPLPEHVDGETGQQLVARAHKVWLYSNATRGNIAVEIVVN